MRTQANAAGAVFETERHPNKASALKQPLQFIKIRSALELLLIEGSNGERMEAAEINDWCERAPPQE